MSENERPSPEPEEGFPGEDLFPDSLETEETWDDLEKEALPKRRWARPIWLSAIVAVICLYFIASIWNDLFYSFVNDKPTYLGKAIGFEYTDLPDDSYVSVYGIRNPSRGIRLNPFGNDRNIFQMMGTKRVFVETLVEDDEKQPGLRSRTFSGRLKRLGNLPSFTIIQEFAAYNFGIDVKEDAILIVAHEKPEDMWHIPFIFGLLLLILAVNIFLFVRRLVKAKAS